MTRGLYAWLFSRLDGCMPLRTKLDTEDGVRRMDRAERSSYSKLLAFGRVTRAGAPGYGQRPIFRATVLFSAWVRPETTEAGDMALEDLQDHVLRALVWRSPSNPIPGQDCTRGDPGILVMDSEHVAGDEEPFFDEVSQSWTKSWRIAFLVNIATCAEPLEWCNPPCPELDNGSSEGESASGAFLATAYNNVAPSEEAFVEDFDLYVCHPLVNTTTLEANTPNDSLKLFYSIVSAMPRFSSSYFVGQRAVASESDYWHSATPAAESNRIAYSSALFHLRPSAALGAAIATYLLSATSSYFDGIYVDESYGDQGLGNPFHVPDEWWAAWKGVAPADNGGVPLTDADRPYWEGQFDAMMAAAFATLKAGMGSSRAIVANTAGGVFPGITGVSIEEGHVALHGEAWALERFEAQRGQWEGDPDRFGVQVLNIAWNSGIQEAGLVYRGTDDA